MTKKGSEEPASSDTKQAEVWRSYSRFSRWPFWPYSFFSRAQRTDVGASQEDTITPPETAQPPTTPEPEPRELSPVPNIQEEKHQVKRRRSARLNKRSVSPTEEAPATPPSPPKKAKVKREYSTPAPQSSVPEEDPIQTQREGTDKASSRDKRQSRHPDPTDEKTKPHDTDHAQYPDPADCPAYYLRGATWFSYDDDEIHKKLKVIQERLQEWSAEWVTVEKQLSDEEKQKLIAGLEGYCLQGDWASLVERLPANILELLPLVITRALVTKDLFQNVIEDPFFYLNEDGEKVTGEHGQVSIPSRAEVHNLWQWCKQVEPSGVRDKWNSRKWLQITVRFLNAFTRETTFDPLLATHMKLLRDCILQRLAYNLLHESSLLHPLLKTVSESARARRYQELLHIYQIAGDLCIGMWTNEMDFEFGSFDSLGPFHEDIPHMKKHCYAEHEWKEKSDPASKGRTVLFMLQPTLTRYCRYGREEDESLISKAVVIFSKDDA
ncbi:hypothetical protein ANOM_002418 [Aspergillus nomiae NRRL 13137]|uniref:Uncharacterized protein n=1 Tax=Aspergillus nomiae NRRL (strain ATCC 15546 / NRRL 13137 / CBS 260.88 / M93) TaxID=1509407 RepID=A0A0L1JBE2_ASPN3|nr:uncharacterized protein ANOM_002418 [Aspergillus nomiae NRRL 13137]KNG89032.1 hypothetical protein ANOM_002418 [Aspergillus nomiae NRRL 13137]